MTKPSSDLESNRIVHIFPYFIAVLWSIKMFVQQGLPLYLSNPEKSIFRWMKYTDLCAASASEVQDILRHKNIALYDVLVDILSFDVNGLQFLEKMLDHIIFQGEFHIGFYSYSLSKCYFTRPIYSHHWLGLQLTAEKWHCGSAPQGLKRTQRPYSECPWLSDALWSQIDSILVRLDSLANHQGQTVLLISTAISHHRHEVGTCREGC